jgi:hypothetical protein
VLRNDSNDLSARLKNGISDDAHQTDVPAAVDQAPPFGGENRT